MEGCTPMHTIVPQGRTSTHARAEARTRIHAHMCAVRETSFSLFSTLYSPLLSRALSLLSLSPFLLILQNVRHCVSRTETVAGRARSAESRYEIYGALGDVAMGLKIYPWLHVLVNPITNMAHPRDRQSRDFVLAIREKFRWRNDETLGIILFLRISEPKFLHYGSFAAVLLLYYN